MKSSLPWVRASSNASLLLLSISNTTCHHQVCPTSLVPPSTAVSPSRWLPCRTSWNLFLCSVVALHFFFFFCGLHCLTAPRSRPATWVFRNNFFYRQIRYPNLDPRDVKSKRESGNEWKEWCPIAGGALLPGCFEQLSRWKRRRKTTGQNILEVHLSKLLHLSLVLAV